MATLTAFLIGLALVVAGIVDIVAVYYGNPTVSTVIQSWSRAFPILPLIVGILLGHLFWPRTAP